jgi:Asp-tRNA(Asn)/Glu-tRNA(Gln) amidotransferase A subunit family amidase
VGEAVKTPKADAPDIGPAALSLSEAAGRIRSGTLSSVELVRATLDRIEVSGTRLKRTDLQVPVSDDAQLPVSEWLERVRTRYGLGDAGAAKKSLLLFVKDHPGEPVPDDLEPLLEK